MIDIYIFIIYTKIQQNAGIPLCFISVFEHKISDSQ